MKPLEGVRVLSLAQQYPGPYATLILSDLGADVVMVERPGGDPSRSDPGFFGSLNRNKRSVVLDLKVPAQHARLLALARKCDVFMEGFRPGVAQHLGIDHASIAAGNSGVIYVSISAFGQSGPYRDRPAHDLSLQALAGILHGRAAGATEAPYIAWGDLSSGTFAALGVLAGLYARTRTGKGMQIDVAMVDTLLSWMTVFLGPVLNGLQPLDLKQPGFGCYACQDGLWLSVSVTLEDHHWHRLASAVGLDCHAHLDAQARAQRFDELRAALAGCFAAQPRDAWAEVLDLHGVAWSPVLSPAETAADPQLLSRGQLARVAGQWQIAQPLKIDGETLGPSQPVPRLGEHDGDAIWT